MGKEGVSDIYDLIHKLKRSATPLPEAEEELRKLFKKNGYDRGITLYNSFDENYRLWGKINMSWPNANTFGPDYDVFHPATGRAVKVPDRGWRWKKETFEEAAGIVDGTYREIKELHDGSYMCGRIWFSAKDDQQPSSVTYFDDVNDFLLRSILSTKSDGGLEVEDLLGEKNIFSHPKPTSLIKTFISARPPVEGEIVVDFFAGSGTTAHAVMLQTAEDGSARRFVMVQLPEPLSASSKEQKAASDFLKRLGKPFNIAELTKERLRRAGTEVRKDNPKAAIDTGFRVYKLATSNLKPWQPDPDNLEASILDAVDNVLPDRTEHDLLVELLLKTGIDLTMPEDRRIIAGQTVHALGGGALMVCLGNVGPDDAETLGQGMADWLDELDPTQTTIYFKDVGLGTDNNRSATKANLAAILRQRHGDRIAKIASI
jgi:adenine-specific DNA-methyltransferase